MFLEFSIIVHIYSCSEKTEALMCAPADDIKIAEIGTMPIEKKKDKKGERRIIIIIDIKLN